MNCTIKKKTKDEDLCVIMEKAPIHIHFKLKKKSAKDWKFIIHYLLCTKIKIEIHICLCMHEETLKEDKKLVIAVTCMWWRCEGSEPVATEEGKEFSLHVHEVYVYEYDCLFKTHKILCVKGP